MWNERESSRMRAVWLCEIFLMCHVEWILTIEFGRVEVTITCVQHKGKIICMRLKNRKVSKPEYIESSFRCFSVMETVKEEGEGTEEEEKETRKRRRSKRRKRRDTEEKQWGNIWMPEVFACLFPSIPPSETFLSFLPSFSVLCPSLLPTWLPPSLPSDRTRNRMNVGRGEPVKIKTLWEQTKGRIYTAMPQNR